MTSENNKYLNLLRDFSAKYPLRHFKKDRPLFYQGEVPQSAFFVKSGVVKYYNISSSGEEKIVGYETTDGLIPLEWIFNRSPVALYYYDSFTDTQIHSIPRSELVEFISSKHELTVALLNRYVGAYIGKTIHLHALEQSKAKEKLLYLFQYLVLRFGEEVSKDNFRVGLRLTHQDIANFMGVTRETVSTEISKLTKDGIVKTEDLHYVINTDKALRLLGESDFNKLVL
jgi:CRP/FNR family transcriptional regulator, cyclic AMP receptor protein